jgi:hypothetical protein
VELATAIALDERDELGLSQNLEANIPGAEEPFDADSELPPLTDEQKGKLDSLNSMLAQAGKGLNRGQLDDLLGRLGYDGAAEELDDRVRELRASLEKGDKPDKAEKGRRRQAEPESKTEAKVEPKAESKPEPKGDPPATLFTL